MSLAGATRCWSAGALIGHYVGVGQVRRIVGLRVVPNGRWGDGGGFVDGSGVDETWWQYSTGNGGEKLTDQL